jgi:hypothetical protein
VVTASTQLCKHLQTVRFVGTEGVSTGQSVVVNRNLCMANAIVLHFTCYLIVVTVQFLYERYQLFRNDATLKNKIAILLERLRSRDLPLKHAKKPKRQITFGLP